MYPCSFFGTGEHPNVPSFRFFGAGEHPNVHSFLFLGGAGEHPPRPPFWKPPFKKPKKRFLETTLKKNLKCLAVF